MQNSEWDKQLRDLLGDFRPGDDQPHWEDFARHLDARDTPSTEDDPLQDDELHDALTRYQPDAEVSGWERIEASLNAADKAFDDQVRKKIHHYEPHFDPLAWPNFLKTFADKKLLRAKLIALKVVECAAILLLLFTVVNMGRLGKLPFDTPLYDTPAQDLPATTAPGDRADAGSSTNTEAITQADTKELRHGRSLLRPSSDTKAIAQANTEENSHGRSFLRPSSDTKAIAQADANENSHGQSLLRPSPDSKAIAQTAEDEVSPGQSLLRPSSDIQVALHAENTTSPIPELNIHPLQGAGGITNQPPLQGAGGIPNQHPLQGAGGIPNQHPLQGDGGNTGDIALNTPYITDYLSSIDPHLDVAMATAIPSIEYIPVRPGTFLEFSMLTQADYNKLRMPEDRLYSAGKQIVFPVQGIPSHGFGAGFTMAIGHPVWALETGIIYSSKDFKPGRRMVVGGAFDNGSVEFESMSLQMVSVPVQYRYRFERKGRLKSYALAGFAAHVIAQSDIDIVIKYHFPSLAAGANPNNDPYFAQTIRETRRISQHIRDGAPFSTKSFFSLNAGLGMEYTLTPHKTLFLQSVFQYQIPNLRFSNNDGKHLRSLSLQAGVRTPLGE